MPSEWPQLHADVIRIIYGFLPDIGDVIRCMSVNSEWLLAGLTLEELTYCSLSESHEKSMEQNLLMFMHFLNHQNRGVQYLTTLAIKSHRPLSAAVIERVLSLAGTGIRGINLETFNRMRGQLAVTPQENQDMFTAGCPLLLYDLLAKCCPGLEFLEFYGRVRSLCILEDPTAPQLASLRHLTLASVRFCTTNDFVCLCANLPELRSLHLADMPLSSSNYEYDADDDWGRIVSDSLEEISVNETYWGALILLSVPHLRALNVECPSGVAFRQAPANFESLVLGYMRWLDVGNHAPLDVEEVHYICERHGRRPPYKGPVLFPALRHLVVGFRRCHHQLAPGRFDGNLLSFLLSSIMPQVSPALEVLEVVHSYRRGFLFALVPAKGPLSPHEVAAISHWPSLEALHIYNRES